MRFHSFLRFFRQKWFGRKAKTPSPKGRTPGRTPLFLEPLERRELMSVTPTILSVVPVNNSKTATASPTIMITYNEAMGASAFNASNYILLGSGGTPIPINSVTSGSGGTTATINYNSGQPLPISSYSLFVRGNLVTDTAGDPLAQSSQLIAANAGQSTVSVVNVPGTGTLGALSNYNVPGTGNGFFQQQPNPYAVAYGDLNGDGLPDLVVVNSQTNQVAVYLGQPVADGGGFNTTPDLLLDLPTGGGSQGKSVIVANLTGSSNGRLDIAVANQNSNNITVFLNTSPGAGVVSFASGTNYATTGTPVALAVGDVDGDGNPDLVVADSNAPGKLGSDTNNGYRVDVFHGLGGGSFSTTPLTFQVGDTAPSGLQAPTSVIVADLNNDGKPDVAVGGTNGIALLANTSTPGNIAFTTPPPLIGTMGVTALAVGALDASGKPDIVATGSTFGQGQVQVLTNLGNFNFVSSVFSLPSNAGQVTLGDVNGDGRPDLAVTSENSNGQVSVLTTAGAITNISGPGTSPIVITSPNHGLVSGERVTVSVRSATPPPTAPIRSRS